MVSIKWSEGVEINTAVRKASFCAAISAEKLQELSDSKTAGKKKSKQSFSLRTEIVCKLYVSMNFLKHMAL